MKQNITVTNLNQKNNWSSDKLKQNEVYEYIAVDFVKPQYW